MCGRYGFTKIDALLLGKRFNISTLPNELVARFNISPQQQVPAILNTSPTAISMVRWGLIPHWAKDEKIGYRLINARAESIAEKPSFRRAIRSQRCLILADCFYEWKKTNGTKQPYRILLKNEEVFSFAGIWDKWIYKGNELITCSIITTEANRLLADIHDRMPVILAPEEERIWLKPNDLTKILPLLEPYAADKMKAYPISKLINSPVNDTADVLRPV